MYIWILSIVTRGPSLLQTFRMATRFRTKNEQKRKFQFVDATKNKKIRIIRCLNKKCETERSIMQLRGKFKWSNTRISNTHQHDHTYNELYRWHVRGLSCIVPCAIHTSCTLLRVRGCMFCSLTLLFAFLCMRMIPSPLQSYPGTLPYQGTIQKGTLRYKVP